MLPLRDFTSDALGPTEQLLPKRRGLLDGIHHPPVELLENPRDPNDDGGANGERVFRDRLDRPRVGDGNPLIQHRVIAGHPLEYVAER